MTQYKIFHKSILYLFVLSAVSFVAIIYFGWKADRSMSKDGFGNYQQFVFWNNYAGYALYSFIISIVSGFIILIVRSIRSIKYL
jgi:ABC-type spermidine/putrescine transport system permease subunit I